MTETNYALAIITKPGVAFYKIAVGVAQYGRSFAMTGPSCRTKEWTIDWAVDLDKDYSLGNNGSDISTSESNLPIVQCDYTTNFDSLDGLHGSLSSYHPYCASVFAVGALANALNTVAGEYNDVSEDYDTLLGYYTKPVDRIVQPVIDHAMDTTAAPFFDCVLETGTQSVSTDSRLSAKSCRWRGAWPNLARYLALFSEGVNAGETVYDLATDSKEAPTVLFGLLLGAGSLPRRGDKFEQMRNVRRRMTDEQFKKFGNVVEGGLEKDDRYYTYLRQYLLQVSRNTLQLV
ncbi:hypothetical protein MY8738_007490 [Beauveria namnaoensis]